MTNEYLTTVHLEWISKHEKQQLSLLQPRSLSTSCDPIDLPPRLHLQQIHCHLLLFPNHYWSRTQYFLWLDHQVQEKLLSLSLSLSLSVKARLLQRVSLGGIRDEAQICTYVASTCGFIIQVFHIASCIHPVTLLNEVGQSNLHGDLSAALREVLDLEQNWSWPLRTGLWCPSRLGRMDWSSNEPRNTEKWIREVGVWNLERTITGVVMFKQWAKWEEKYESDGYVPLSEELESSSSSSTFVMYIQL